ncbi:MAG: N-6 DNA methylase [Prevotella sp.]|nr:N-6 DNA methylase [Prevotella sp.]
MITEKEYIRRTSIEHRKRFAQFFTPEQIADYMAEWVMEDIHDHADILEPAYGLGIFSRSMFKSHQDIKVNGYDVDETIFQYALSNASETQCEISLSNENYLTSSWDKKYDGIICNPPYMKFHDYDNSTLVPLVNSKLHIKLNGFTNIYTLFLLKSIYQLKQGGRLAYIIPSEFLNADYGVEVKRALLDSGTLRHVIIVDFNQCAFDDALTTACILFCQNTTDPGIVKFSNVKNVTDLSTALTDYTDVATGLLDPEQKWKSYYEETQASQYNHLVPFSTFAKVSRGIATGANDYFTFKQSKKDFYNIPDSCFLPCICHSTDVKSLIFTDEDFEQLTHQDKTVFLFNGSAGESNSHVKDYLRMGVENEINKRYLTANRYPWYALENQRPAPIWVSVFSRSGLRFVRNKANVYNLTTFHCVYNISEIDTNILFAYLITNVAKEIFLDNSRQYGNGLVKFEPNDLNKGKAVDLRLLTNEESDFVSQVYKKLRHYGAISQQYIDLLNDFFVTKYTVGQVRMSSFEERLDSIKDYTSVRIRKRVKTERVKQLNFFDIFDRYSNSPIVENYLVSDDPDLNRKRKGMPQIDLTRNCLISFIKKDNMSQFEDQTAKIYYTGKKFPATVQLNNLYYFMPYLKGKGIRDLYLIKVARVGMRKEGQVDEDPKDIRLVFEIEYVEQLFEDYKPIELKIWRTFTDTTLQDIIV